MRSMPSWIALALVAAACNPFKSAPADVADAGATVAVVASAVPPDVPVSALPEAPTAAVPHADPSALPNGDQEATRADKAVNQGNYKQELDTLEKELADDSPSATAAPRK